MNKELKEQARKELEEKKFETILGGYCWFQDGGNGGYEYEDILKIIDSIIDKTVQSTEYRIVEDIEVYRTEKGFTCANFAIDEIIKLITNKNTNK